MIEPSAEWRERAECNTHTQVAEIMSNAWIEEQHFAAETARDICVNDCPVRDSCLIAAIADPESYGLRAGYFFKNGGLTRADSNAVRAEMGVIVRVRQKSRKTRSEPKWQTPSDAKSVAT